MEELQMQNGFGLEKQPKDRRSQGIASLVIGICGVIFMLIPVFNLINVPAQIVGFILGLSGRKSSGKGMATAGIVLSCIALVLSVLSVFIMIVNFNYSSSSRVSTGTVENRINDNGGITADLYPKTGDSSKEITEVQLEAAKAVISYRPENLGIDSTVAIDKQDRKLNVKIAGNKGEDAQKV